MNTHTVPTDHDPVDDPASTASLPSSHITRLNNRDFRKGLQARVDRGRQLAELLAILEHDEPTEPRSARWAMFVTGPAKELTGKINQWERRCRSTLQLYLGEAGAAAWTGRWQPRQPAATTSPRSALASKPASSSSKALLQTYR
ncbi:MAG: hypothetical protein V9G12_07740 [Microthrixaceae bacterium]